MLVRMIYDANWPHGQVDMMHSILAIGFYMCKEISPQIDLVEISGRIQIRVMIKERLGSWVVEMDGRWGILSVRMKTGWKDGEDGRLSDGFRLTSLTLLDVWIGLLNDWKAKRSILKSMLWFGPERFFVGLETTSKLEYSQIDGMENL
ncbi:hypothetical protein DY000_02030760 [Brassica cretica]|uniref:DUF4283 domain-containing protein n=1 Tax=Brassica cretica TaxID=69181 RepID=A0ABQ7DWV9_BRACR|nr:hypothetical protein DY000_02030760 [Brassica cretica]